MSQQLRKAILLHLDSSDRADPTSTVGAEQLAEALEVEESEIERQLDILGSQHRAEVVRTSGGHSARITPAGRLEVERLQEEEEALARILEAVKGLLRADLSAAEEQLRKTVRGFLDEQAARNVLQGGPTLRRLQEIGAEEIQRRGGLLAAAWLRALPSFPTQPDVEEVKRRAMEALEEQLQEVTLTVNTLTPARLRKGLHGDGHDFRHAFYRAQDRLLAEIELTMAEQDAETTEAAAGEPVGVALDEVFVVHGHDEGAMQGVARFLEQLGLRPIILHEQPSQGQTLIEKLERHSAVGFAVVLLTPDDQGRKVGEEGWKQRARQNVVLELGYFLAKLTRAKVCALVKGEVEQPFDYHGVVYIPLDEAGGWKGRLGRELQAAGFDVSMDDAS